MNMLDLFKSEIVTRPAPVVFELGACDGEHTLQMVEMLEVSGKPYRYFAFEPVAELMPCIRNRMGKLLGKITLTQAAVGAIEGKGAFHKSDAKYYGSSSLRAPTAELHKSWPDMRFKDAVVDVVTLDSFCIRNGVDHIDFIWSDIQGAEGDMIAGGRSALASADWLFIECHAGLYDGSVTESDLLKMLPWFSVHGRDDAGGLILRK